MRRPNRTETPEFPVEYAMPTFPTKEQAESMLLAGTAAIADTNRWALEQVLACNLAVVRVK